MSTKNILSKEFNSLKNDLIAAYNEKGMRASGNWADQLEVYTEENVAVIFGADYTEQLEHGRNPNNGSSGESWDTTVEDIEQWIYDKGIANRIEGEITVSSLAFIIARKIWREGWDRREHGGVELVSEIVTPERIQSIINEVGDARIIEFTSEISNLLNELNV